MQKYKRVFHKDTDRATHTENLVKHVDTLTRASANTHKGPHLQKNLII